MLAPSDQTVHAPIACALDAEAFGDRVAAWTALARRALIATTASADDVVLRFRRERGVEKQLRRLVRLEGACCPYLVFGLARVERELVLTICGPQPTAE
ncbi:MAG: hypothetical protein M3336_00920, partial [Chloroflexota bacterium]|nr:hypothetical protein [Chloroflexota bacterium]